jgi:hypothetical protein
MMWASLSQGLVKHFGLEREQLVQLSRGAVDGVFGGEDEKQRMWALLDRFRKEGCGGELW